MLTKEKGDYVPSSLAKEFLVVAEDHRFYCHGGIDPIAVCRAIWRTIALNKYEGASTIEMQLIRVVSQRTERSLSRKVREMALATLLSKEFSKNDLTDLYLKIGYYGWRMLGYRQACKRLQKNTDSLTPFENAKLVARLKYPEPKFEIVKRQNQINLRAKHILMLHNKYQKPSKYFYTQTITIGIYPKEKYLNS